MAYRWLAPVIKRVHDIEKAAQNVYIFVSSLVLNSCLYVRSGSFSQSVVPIVFTLFSSMHCPPLCLLWFVSLYVSLFVCSSVSVCTSLCQSVRLCLSVCLLVYLYVCLHVSCLSVRLSVCLSVCTSLSVFLSVRLSVCLIIWFYQLSWQCKLATVKRFESWRFERYPFVGANRGIVGCVWFICRGRSYAIGWCLVTWKTTE